VEEGYTVTVMEYVPLLPRTTEVRICTAYTSVYHPNTEGTMCLSSIGSAYKVMLLLKKFIASCDVISTWITRLSASLRHYCNAHNHNLTCESNVTQMKDSKCIKN
jgi:hypothetical protein